MPTLSCGEVIQKDLDSEMRLDAYERCLRKRGAGLIAKESVSDRRGPSVDEETLNQMIKLGYSDSDVRSQFSNNDEMIGKLYQRLL